MYISNLDSHFEKVNNAGTKFPQFPTFLSWIEFCNLITSQEKLRDIGVTLSLFFLHKGTHECSHTVSDCQNFYILVTILEVYKYFQNCIGLTSHTRTLIVT